MDRHSLVIGKPIDVELIELPEEWAILLNQRICVIDEVLEGWGLEEHQCLSVRMRDGRRFMLRHETLTDRWTACAFLRAEDPY